MLNSDITYFLSFSFLMQFSNYDIHNMLFRCSIISCLNISHTTRKEPWLSIFNPGPIWRTGKGSGCCYFRQMLAIVVWTSLFPTHNTLYRFECRIFLLWDIVIVLLICSIIDDHSYLWLFACIATKMKLPVISYLCNISTLIHIL